MKADVASLISLVLVWCPLWNWLPDDKSTPMRNWGKAFNTTPCPKKVSIKLHSKKTQLVLYLPVSNPNPFSAAVECMASAFHPLSQNHPRHTWMCHRTGWWLCPLPVVPNVTVFKHSEMPPSEPADSLTNCLCNNLWSGESTLEWSG